MTKKVIIISLLLVFTILPFVSLAEGLLGNPSGLSLPNPLGTTSDLPDLVNKIIGVVLDLLLVVAVVYLVYAGFLFVKAQGNPDAINDAKSNLLWAVIGLAVILGAQAIADFVKNTITGITK